MLKFIFGNSLPEYYNESSHSKNKKYIVDVDEYSHTHSNFEKNVEDDYDLGYGYYVDLDNTTPPKIQYLKNKNTPTITLNLPKKNYTTNHRQQVKYLPTIEEEIFKTTEKNITYDITTTSSVVSGVTFCATIAFYYFYRTIRNN
jgi:hypothetical protein